MTPVRYAPVAVLIGGIAVCLALSLPLALALTVAAIAAYASGRHAGFSARELLRFGWDGVIMTRPVLIILFLVGLLIPLLMVGGAIPTLIWHGLGLVRMEWLLTVSFALAAAVSYLLGTSVGTLSTIGLALMGIAHAAELPSGMMAGALISGAMVGERFSPLSSSRLLAIHTVRVNDRAVTRFALPTGLAALVLSAAAFGLLDGWREVAWAGEAAGRYRELLASHGLVSAGSLLPLILLVASFVLRVKAIPALLIGVAAAGMQAVLAGPEGVAWSRVVLYGYELRTGTELDRLVHGGGMLAILEVLLLISLAGFMNGILDKAQLLKPLIDRLMGRPRSVPVLVGKTAALSLLAAVVSCNQTIPLLVVGSTLRERFAGYTGGDVLLGRTMLDSTLVMPVWVPWNGLAMVMSITLGVPTVESLPWLVFPLLLPLVTVWFSRFAGGHPEARPAA